MGVQFAPNIHIKKEVLGIYLEISKGYQIPEYSLLSK